MVLAPGQLIASVRSARAWHHDYEVGKLGGPVDRNEWHMNPQTVNAYYNPEMNEIVFQRRSCSHHSSRCPLTMRSTTVPSVR